MTAPPPPAPLSGRTALVLGLGRFSGGVETVRFLAAQGATVIVSDTAAPETLEASTAAVAGTGATTRLRPPDAGAPRPSARGRPRRREPRDPVRPPRAPSRPLRRGARGHDGDPPLPRARAGARPRRHGHEGQEHHRRPCSRPCSRASGRAHAPRRQRRAARCSTSSTRIGPDDAVVLELSSFQLHGPARRSGFRPAGRRGDQPLPRPPRPPRHHGALRGAPSARSSTSQTADDVAVLPCARRDPRAGSASAPPAARAACVFDTAPSSATASYVTAEGNLADARGAGGTDLAAFRLWGAHNRGNAAAAAAAARAFGCDVGRGARGRGAPEPLHHRLEPVDEIGRRPLRGRLHRHDAAERDRRARGRPAAAASSSSGGKDKGSDASLAREGASPRRAPRRRRHRHDGPRARRRRCGARGGPPAEVAERRPRPRRRPCARRRPWPGPGTRSSSRPGYSSLDQYPVVRGARRPLPGRRASPRAL